MKKEQLCLCQTLLHSHPVLLSTYSFFSRVTPWNCVLKNTPQSSINQIEYPSRKFVDEKYEELKLPELKNTVLNEIYHDITNAVKIELEVTLILTIPAKSESTAACVKKIGNAKEQLANKD